jgi:hypothetical protein
VLRPLQNRLQSKIARAGQYDPFRPAPIGHLPITPYEDYLQTRAFRSQQQIATSPFVHLDLRRSWVSLKSPEMEML